MGLRPTAFFLYRKEKGATVPGQYIDIPVEQVKPGDRIRMGPGKAAHVVRGEPVVRVPKATGKPAGYQFEYTDGGWSPELAPGATVQRKPKHA